LTSYAWGKVLERVSGDASLGHASSACSVFRDITRSSSFLHNKSLVKKEQDENDEEGDRPEVKRLGLDRLLGPFLQRPRQGRIPRPTAAAGLQQSAAPTAEALQGCRLVGILTADDEEEAKAFAPRLAAFYLAARDDGLEIVFLGQSLLSLFNDPRYSEMPWHMVRESSERGVRKAIPEGLTANRGGRGGPVVVVFDRHGTVCEKNAAPMISRIADEETRTLAPAAMVHWAARGADGR